MAAQITQTFTPPTTAPSRSQNPTTFNTNVDNRLAWDATHVTEMETWQTQANTLSTDVNANAVAAEASKNAAATSETNAATSEAAAAASAVFKGLWSSLSGALNMPASVVHNNIIWLLNTNSADVTADEPGVSSKWTILVPQNIQRAREIGGTAYQNIAGFPLAPSFELKTYDYINEVNGFHPQATVSRATTATYPDHKGVMQTAAADVLRHWWDPATGEYRGIIVEEASTNLVTHSQELDNAVWVKAGATVTVNNAIAPDGTTTMDKLVEDSSTAAHAVTDSLTISAGTHVASVFVSAGEYDQFRFLIGHSGESTAQSVIPFSLTSGPTTTTNGLITNAGIEDLGNGIKRCWIKYTLTVAAVTHAMQLRLTQTLGGSDTYTGDGVSGLNFWGMQCEKLTEMTSYIPTSGATATRAADSVKFDGTDFSGWFNATEGTIFLSMTPLIRPATNRRVLDIGSGSGDGDRITLAFLFNGKSQAIVSESSTTHFLAEPSGPTAIPDKQKTKVSLSYKVNDFASSGDGGNLTTGTSGNVPSVVRMHLGSSQFGSVHFNGCIDQIIYFPRQINDSLLQVLSA